MNVGAAPGAGWASRERITIEARVLSMNATGMEFKPAFWKAAG
jgi:hypothetical protein